VAKPSKRWLLVAKIRYSTSASKDIILANHIIRQYFNKIQSPNLCKKYLSNFKQELKEKEEVLKTNPKAYPVYDKNSFFDMSKEFRHFAIQWFTVFYTCTETEGVVIWYIKSSKSNLLNLQI
jgi:hypothetical protein